LRVATAYFGSDPPDSVVIRDVEKHDVLRSRAEVSRQCRSSDGEPVWSNNRNHGKVAGEDKEEEG
jgi:hypothetical protein